MADIFHLDVETTLDIPIAKVLENAPKNMDLGIVLGWMPDGELYFSSSTADTTEILWLLKKAEKSLLEL